MSPILGEFAGTAMLIAIGASVNANVVLAKTKGESSGWIVISLGWAMAVFIGVYSATALGGSGHLNPAVTLPFAAVGIIDWAVVPGYLAAQFGGAFVGAVVAWAAFRPHFKATSDADLKLAVFSTSPAIRHFPSNFITEAVATFVLVFGALLATPPTDSLGALDALPVALLVLAIGAGLGGPTGFAINPARDLGPRIAHYLLPIPGKRDSDWAYSWLPVVAPILGGLLAVFLHQSQP